MRRCLDCGAENPDVAMKCEKCNSENLSFIEQEEKEKHKNKTHTYIIFILVGIAVVLSAIFVIMYSSKNVPAKPVENAVIALSEGDLEAFLEEVPEKMKADVEDYFLEENGSFEAYKSNVSSQLEQNFGEGYKISAKLIDYYDFSDELLESINSYCKEQGYNIEFSDAKHITLRLMIESKNEETKNYSAVESYSVELDGKWYYLPIDFIGDSQTQETE